MTPVDKHAPPPARRRMLRALALTVTQLADPAIIKVLIKSLALTLAIFALLGVGLVALTRWAIASYGLGEDAGFAAAAAATLGAFALGWLLFRAVAIPVISLFADEIVAAVEARHYPEAAHIARKVPLSLSLRLAAGSLGRLIALNLAALPLYGVLLVTGIGAPLLFLLVNALLLGRDLGEMVAVRHLDRAGVQRWLGDTRAERLAVGLIAAALFLIPFANLLAPVMGAGLATHRFHGRKA